MTYFASISASYPSEMAESRIPTQHLEPSLDEILSHYQSVTVQGDHQIYRILYEIPLKRFFERSFPELWSTTN